MIEIKLICFPSVTGFSSAKSGGKDKKRLHPLPSFKLETLCCTKRPPMATLSGAQGRRIFVSVAGAAGQPAFNLHFRSNSDSVLIRVTAN